MVDTRERWREAYVKKSIQISGGAKGSCLESWQICFTPKSAVTVVIRGNALRREITIRKMQFHGRSFIEHPYGSVLSLILASFWFPGLRKCFVPLK